ncbi:MAG: 30S ribosomal protein S12 methylthiotransferase RimO [Clostridium sp.]|nr:30S ribosomal protein S12 methylthiotransferase RimO [Clostridium sp.]
MQKDTNRRTVNVVSLGCSKNLVDAERLMKQLEDLGFKVSFEKRPPRRGRPFDAVVINTCGFIGDAKEQSINEILEWAEAKGRGRVGTVCVMGCLSERYPGELRESIPEVDAWFGKFDWGGIGTLLSRKAPGAALYDRILTTPRHHAYIKISEGCNRFCAFCAIPLITGRHHSRPVDEIVDEVRRLAGRGVREFNVIAQDLSAYGTDLPGGESRLAELVDRIADVEGVEWIRLHYAYPAGFPLDLLDVMARRKNVCRYLDIALQHGSDKVLTAMKRHITIDQTRRLLAEIRRRVPGIHLRTTMMTGFPGEDEEAFGEMLEFVREQRFERLGGFTYCEEEGTFAANNLPDTIPQEVKEERLRRLMELQEEISAEISREKIGKRLRVVIDRKENDRWIGRTEWDSPEVDPEVIVSSDKPLRVGSFYDVEITDAMPFELIGKVSD